MKDISRLSLDSWKKIILDIKNFSGPCFLSFYGGEVFLREDFLELVHLCSSYGFYSIITSNGTLINKSVTCELVKNDPMISVNISLDGYKPQTHDRLRGVAGIYHKAMSAIELLKGKIPLQIITTIMEDNIDEILDLVNFAEKNGLSISFQGYADLWKKPEPGEPPLQQHRLFPKDPGKIDFLFDELIARKKVGCAISNSLGQLKNLKLYFRDIGQLKNKGCGALFNNRLAIQETGDVCICGLEEPVGNLLDFSLRDLYLSKSMADTVRRMSACERENCLGLICYQKQTPGYLLGKIQRIL